MSASRIQHLAVGSLLLLACSSAARAEDGDGGQLDPDAESVFYEGNARLAAGDAAGAVMAFDRALEIAPDFYRVHLYRARAFLALQDTGSASDALDAFESRASSDAERLEAAIVRAGIAAFVVEPPPGGSDPVNDDGPPSGSVEPRIGEPAAVRLGVLGGYALTRQESLWHWGLVQLRVEVHVWRGLSLRSQVGIGLQSDAEVLYGFVPVAVGITLRTSVHPRPFLDAHALMIANNDGKSADGSTVSDGTRAPGFGVGGGGGVEIDIVRRGKFGLSLAPEVQVGWAGVLLIHGGISVRAALGGQVRDPEPGS